MLLFLPLALGFASGITIFQYVFLGWAFSPTTYKRRKGFRESDEAQPSKELIQPFWAVLRLNMESITSSSLSLSLSLSLST